MAKAEVALARGHSSSQGCGKGDEQEKFHIGRMQVGSLDVVNTRSGEEGIPISRLPMRQSGGNRPERSVSQAAL